MADWGSHVIHSAQNISKALYTCKLQHKTDDTMITSLTDDNDTVICITDWFLVSPFNIVTCKVKQQ